MEKIDINKEKLVFAIPVIINILAILYYYYPISFISFLMSIYVAITGFAIICLAVSLMAIKIAAEHKQYNVIQSFVDKINSMDDDDDYPEKTLKKIKIFNIVSLSNLIFFSIVLGWNYLAIICMFFLYFRLIGENQLKNYVKELEEKLKDKNNV